MDHDDAVTLVNTNAEALNIAAWYARRRSDELHETLWQWRAENTVWGRHTNVFTLMSANLHDQIVQTRWQQMQS